jgi:hypothetical protein
MTESGDREQYFVFLILGCLFISEYLFLRSTPRRCLFIFCLTKLRKETIRLWRNILKRVGPQLRHLIFNCRVRPEANNKLRLLLFSMMTQKKFHLEKLLRQSSGDALTRESSTSSRDRAIEIKCPGKVSLLAKLTSNIVFPSWMVCHVATTKSTHYSARLGK